MRIARCVLNSFNSKKMRFYRISFIERLTSDADVYYNKQVEEEQTVLIAKCQNLMKRTKEKAKKAKQKKDENLNLPW